MINPLTPDGIDTLLRSGTIEEAPDGSLHWMPTSLSESAIAELRRVAAERRRHPIVRWLRRLWR